MTEAMVETFTDIDPKDALVVLAFTSTGAAAPIASAYLRQQLDLPLVGQVDVPDLGPIVQVQGGIATGPIRIHGGDVVCTLGRECRGLYVISSELPLPMEIVEPVAEAITRWAKGASMILALDAVARDESDKEPDVFVASDHASAGERLAATKATPMNGGVLVGMSAAMLRAAKADGVDAGALVVEAMQGHPDGRAAAALVHALDPLIPEISIEVAPLMEEAMELEREIRSAMAEAERAQSRRSTHTFI